MRHGVTEPHSERAVSVHEAAIHHQERGMDAELGRYETWKSNIDRSECRKGNLGSFA